jgi:hypothetical protein
MSKQEYQVVAVHSVVLSALIKVEASSEDEAMTLARRKIGDLKPEDFRLEGGGHIQHPYVVEAIATLDISAPEHDFRDTVMDRIRFMTLQANINLGEGCVSVQPWFEEKSLTMQNDLINDWIEELGDIASAGGFQEVAGHTE